MHTQLLSQVRPLGRFDSGFLKRGDGPGTFLDQSHSFSGFSLCPRRCPNNPNPRQHTTPFVTTYRPWPLHGSC